MRIQSAVMSLRPVVLALAALLAPAVARAQIAVPGAFQLTRYWIAHENPQPDDRAARVLDPQGRTLAWCTSRFADALAMEGTGRSWDGRLFNWSSRREGRSCYIEVDPALYPFGIGVAGFALVPYRSLAIGTGARAAGLNPCQEFLIDADPMQAVKTLIGHTRCQMTKSLKQGVLVVADAGQG